MSAEATAPVSTTPSREFTTIGVVGLGTMGAGIAEVFARHGYEVVGVEIDEETLDRGRQHVTHSTARAVARGKLSEAEQSELVDRITFSTDLHAIKDCQFVVEAVIEQLPVKRAVITELDGILGDDAIIATNTSSLSVTEISTATTSRPVRAKTSTMPAPIVPRPTTPTLLILRVTIVPPT